MKSGLPTPMAFRVPVAEMIHALDRRLRRGLHIFEYTRDPGCIFRIRLLQVRFPARLSDGTSLDVPMRVIDIHLWNERLPPLPRRGASLLWACQINRRLDRSLRDLAEFLGREHSLEDIRALRAEVGFTTRARLPQLGRIAAHFGFEAVHDPWRDTLSGRLHLLGENILLFLIVLAYGGKALRWDALVRTRTLLFLSRRALERRYPNVRPRWSPPSWAVSAVCRVGQFPLRGGRVSG